MLLPANEAERLRSLHQYEILHSLQEDLFDELVVLAGALFRLPIAYMSLVDAERVHYKATYGFPRILPRLRAELLCAQVVKQGRVVVYHDLAEAKRTPLDAAAIQNCLEQHARFYAGAPLRMPDQHIIGTLCLVGQQPREFSADEQQLLEELAAIVSRAIVVRHHCHHTPVLGKARWLATQREARDEVYGLGALERYLTARYGPAVPVPDEVLRPVRRRLHDLRVVLQDYEYIRK
jgi:transcriptional regulator with GAF, ATPase, and Fis domain